MGMEFRFQKTVVCETQWFSVGIPIMVFPMLFRSEVQEMLCQELGFYLDVLIEEISA
jgi:hypothetical protein